MCSRAVFDESRAVAQCRQTPSGHRKRSSAKDLPTRCTSISPVVCVFRQFRLSTRRTGWSRLRFSVDEFQEAGRQSFDVVRLTLPYDHGGPSEFVEVHQSEPVALHVFVKLLLPEGGARLRRRGLSATVVPVPETPVNENELSARGETDIGCSGKISSMQTESVAETMQRSPDGEFRSCIPGTDVRHVGAALW